MAVSLSKDRVISRALLLEIAEARLAESTILLQANCAASSIYLAGYSVECCLKAAICTTLRWESLLGTFRVHDLNGLLLYSGFDDELRSNKEVFESFAKVSAIWTVEGPRSIRYQNPKDFDVPTAARFMEYVADKEIGVVPWLRKRVS